MICRIAGVLLVAVSACSAAAPSARLGIAGARFTVDSKPTFLLGISYYAGLGADEATLKADLDDIEKHGFNWIRVWATWAAFDNDVSAVTTDGEPREPFLGKLISLVTECQRRRLVVDVTISRGNGVTGPPRLQSPTAHRRAVETVVTALKPYGNWYLDLSNERNMADKRFTSFDDLKTLRERVRQLDPSRLVTASHAGDISADDLKQYVTKAGVDFLTPHRPRGPQSHTQTAAQTREYLAQMKQLDRIVPVHYQEPFRRDFSGKQNPTAADFVADLAAARGAAGWCFHNGDNRKAADGRPRRSFDVSRQTMFAQFDEEERKFLATLLKPPGASQPQTRLDPADGGTKTSTTR